MNWIKKKHELKILTMSHLDVANKFKLIMNLADLDKSKPFFSVQFCFDFLTLLKTDFIDGSVDSSKGWKTIWWIKLKKNYRRKYRIDYLVYPIQEWWSNNKWPNLKYLDFCRQHKVLRYHKATTYVLQMSDNIISIKCKYWLYI